MTAAKTRKSRAKSSGPRDDVALKRAVLEAALPHLAQDGFTDKTLKEAAAKADVDRVALLRLFPREGLSLVEAFSNWADEQMEAALRKAKPQRPAKSSGPGPACPLAGFCVGLSRA